MIITLENLARELPAQGRVLGLDLGSKTIGIALSDLSRIISSPLKTLKRTKFGRDAMALSALMDEHEIQALILGLPMNMDGTEGPRCQATRQFAENLQGKIDCTIAFWDERWSTQAVTRTLLEADASRARRSELVDKLAASYILQGALDRMRDQMRQ